MLMQRIVTVAASLFVSACDQDAEISKTCSVSLAGVEINPSDLYPDDGAPDHRRWVSAQLVGDCEIDKSKIRVQLFGTNPDLKFLGYGSLDSVIGDCATWIWPASTFADLQSFAITVDNGTPDSSVAAISSLQLQHWLPGSKLPAWKVDGEWSLYLPHPKHVQGCHPVQ